MFLNIMSWPLYQTNVTIIEHGFSPGCLDWTILWFLSMSSGAISIFKFWLIVSIIISSVALPLTWFRLHFLLEYCSSWSTGFLSFETLLDNFLTSDWRFPIIPFFFGQSLYSLNLSEINWTESFSHPAAFLL